MGLNFVLKHKIRLWQSRADSLQQRGFAYLASPACKFDWIQRASTVFQYTRKWHHQIKWFLLENTLHRCVHKHKMLHNIYYFILIGHKTSSLLQRHSCPEQVSLVLFWYIHCYMQWNLFLNLCLIKTEILIACWSSSLNNNEVLLWHFFSPFNLDDSRGK